MKNNKSCAKILLMVFFLFTGCAKTENSAVHAPMVAFQQLMPLVIAGIIIFTIFKFARKNSTNTRITSEHGSYNSKPDSVGKAYHPVNGAIEEIHEGFSWPCFFFGVFWFLHKGMYGWAIISLILSVITWGIAWLIFPFFANALYADSLIKRGYLNQKQWEEKINQGKKTQDSNSKSTVPSSIADELSKLAALKDKGILSPEEFENQKKKLLHS